MVSLTTLRILLFGLLMGSVVCVNAQTTAVKVSVALPDTVHVQVHAVTPVRSWSFLNSYAGTLGLADRIDNFQAGGAVTVKNVAEGEYRSDTDVLDFSYWVRLSTPRAGDVAHLSWLDQRTGLLLLADLLPRELTAKSLTVEFALPQSWNAFPGGTAQQVVNDPDNGVFLVGESVKTATTKADGMPIRFVYSGDWPFSEQKVVKAAARVVKTYSALTKFRLPNTSTVFLAPTPIANGAEWMAETRGSNVVLILDPAANIRNWVGQLEIILTHELFHLWVPNSLQLTGDYDWFFEGFTLYQALLTARELKLISFRGYLDTLARVYDSYLSNNDTRSLIEASESRWTFASSSVYDKGMLVAFLYDLLIRDGSAGKTGLPDTYRELFRNHATKAMDANDAIMTLLSSSPPAGELVRTYVAGRKKLELEEPLKRYGLLLDSKQSATHLTVAENLNEQQFRVLQSLGYKRR